MLRPHGARLHALPAADHAAHRAAAPAGRTSICSGSRAARRSSGRTFFSISSEALPQARCVMISPRRKPQLWRERAGARGAAAEPAIPRARALPRGAEVLRPRAALREHLHVGRLRELLYPGGPGRGGDPLARGEYRRSARPFRRRPLRERRPARCSPRTPPRCSPIPAACARCSSAPRASSPSGTITRATSTPSSPACRNEDPRPARDRQLRPRRRADRAAESAARARPRAL